MAKTIEEKRQANREAQARFWAKFTPEERLAKRKGYGKKQVVPADGSAVEIVRQPDGTTTYSGGGDTFSPGELKYA